MNDFPNPIYLITIIALLSLIPFIAVMATSFVKLSVVFSLLRNALGIQQIPPNMAVHGLCIILSCFIMAPVGLKIFDILDKEKITLSNKDSMKKAVSKGLTPYYEFLKKHSSDSQREFFKQHAKETWPESHKEDLESDSLFILLPAFTVSELTSAFKIGFLLYLPFVAIDLIVSNILLAMGMMMVSPMTISLPFKILLFVLLDGWTKLIQNLILSY
ncbi:MAG: type III secretion system export apparatus subunit SctR [Oligoflexales bacterium]|nr:type III secretion system export apparatus subunit SctR [Oligoflexales bacterium]